MLSRDRLLADRLRFRLWAGAGSKDAALKRAKPGRLGRWHVRSLAVLSLAAVLLAAFAAFLALPAQAQTPVITTLVSNGHLTVSSSSSAILQAQSFVTGANVDGYTVSEVGVYFTRASGRNTSAKIRKNNNNNLPGDLVATLTNPDTLTSASFNTFTAPADTMLDANTTYWISMNEDIASNKAFLGRVIANDETGETGWSIGDGRLSRNTASGAWQSLNDALQIEIRGTSGGTTTQSNDATLSSLNLSNVTLDPAFLAGTQSYTASVANSVTSTTVTAETTDSNATSVVKLDGTVDTDGTVDLAEGNNIITVEVTAEDSTTLTYTITVTRARVGICGRTLAVREGLVAIIPNVSHCADVTAAHLASVTGPLDLAITVLAAGDFDGLTSLTSLYLYENDLTPLPNGVFDGLTKLETLHLYDNDLTTLPNGVFDGLTSLEVLRLDGNNLTTLPSDVFDDLTALETLYLYDNELTTLPSDVFDGLAALETLYLHNNALDTLTVGMFAGLTSLEVLYLYLNGLTTMPDEVFDELTSLKTLRLEDNALATLPDGAFNGLTALTTLYLDNNDLDTLPSDVFDDLTLLTDLYLYSNDIDTLPNGVFEKLTALTDLRLSLNPVAPVAPTADARPDDGTVPAAGGTVMLDGSNSDGGPWGTNVTYAWALTTPTSGATFDNDKSATPEVTIQTLPDGTELTFTLTVTGRGHKDTTFGTDTDTDTATVTATTITTTTPGITVSPTTLPVNEGSTGTYTVLLDTQPTATVTVTINDPTDNTDVTADPASLSFSTSNWSTLQTVTVRAAEDADSAQDTGTVTHTVSGGDYGSVTAADVAVTVTDNDTAGVTVSPTTLPVNEGSTGTYTVLLDTQPTATVTVTINDPTDNTDVTADPASLSFSTSNWSTLQTVTVRAAEDADSAQDTGTVTHTVSGGDYGSVTAADVTPLR